MNEIGPILTASRRPNGELNEALRAAIYSLHLASTTNKAIADQFGCHRNTITKTIQRFQNHQTFESRPRSGRPKKMKPQTIRRLVARVKRSFRSSWNELRGCIPGNPGINTIRRVLPKVYRRKWRSQKRIKLTPLGARQRLSFANEWNGKDQELIEVGSKVVTPLLFSFF